MIHNLDILYQELKHYYFVHKGLIPSYNQNRLGAQDNQQKITINGKNRQNHHSFIFPLTCLYDTLYSIDVLYLNGT